MTNAEKLDYLQTNHMGEWLRAWQNVKDEMSDKQTPMCCCGRLATGLHESACRKFNDKVTTETIERLKHLFKNK